MDTLKKWTGRVLGVLLGIVLMVALMPSTVLAASADNYLTFTAEEAGSTVRFIWASGSNVQIKASSSSVTINGSAATGDWQTYTANTTITLTNVGDKVSFKGKDVTTDASMQKKNYFYMTGKIAGSGDVTSLTNESGGDATLTERCYWGMFYQCTSLTTAPNLPATTLAESCYLGMFDGCTSLTTAPEKLPATTLTKSCYYNMFNDCTSLTTIPALPATKMQDSCYYCMFKDCESLKTAPALPATELANACYYGMFSGCTSLTTAPNLPAAELKEKCYCTMFSGCASLTTAPNLPATELKENCYLGMFYGCTSLTTAPNMSATTMAKKCCCNMLKGCTALLAPAMMDNVTTLAESCCQSMYSGCTNLKIYANSQTGYTGAWKAANTTTGAKDWAADMFTDCGASVSVTAGSTYYILRAINVGAQTGSLTYGTAGSATYGVSFVAVTEPDSFTVAWYDKDDQALSAAPEGVTVAYDKNTDTFTVNTTAATPAGTYKFTLTAAEEGVTSGKAALTVSAKNISGCTVADIDALTYTGSALTPAVTVQDGSTALVKDADYTLSYSNNKNAGTATATVTGKGNYTGSIEKNFTIAKSKELKLVVKNTDVEFGTREYRWTYDGCEHQSDDLIANILTGQVTYQYSTDGGKTWTPYKVSGGMGWSDGNVVDEVVMIKVEDPNYETATCTIDFEITPRELYVTGTTVADKAYDGTTDAAVTAGTLLGVIEGEDTQIDTATGTFEDKNAGEGKNVAVSYTLKGETAGNYTISGESLTANISPRALTVTGTAADGKTYDGTTDAVVGIKGTLSGLVSGDDVTIDTCEASFDEKDVGNGRNVTVKYTLKGEDAGNYTVSDSTTSADIEKKAITIKPDAGQSTEYLYADPVLTYTYSGNVDGETPAFEGALTRAAGEDVTAGGYAIGLGTLALKDNGTFKASNYELQLDETTVYFFVTKAKIDLPTAAGGLVYTGEEQQAFGMLFGAPYGITGVKSAANAGKYTATAALKDKNNYEWNLDTPTSEDQQIEWEIAKRSITLTSGSASKTVDDEPLTCEEVTVTGDGFVTGEGFDYTVTGSQTEVGESLNTFTYTAKEGTLADNYEVTKVEGTLTVSAKPKIIQGADQIIDLSEAESAEFVSDAPFDKFVKVTVDDKDVDAKYYTAASGSTKITFTKAYLKTLSRGTHTIGIVSTTGTAQAQFTVKGSVKSPQTGESIVLLYPAAALVVMSGAVLLRKKKFSI